MKIVHLTAGAGDMYCGSCLQSNTLAASLQATGADVLLVPLYTPLRTDEQSVSIDRVFLGGIRVYLQQRVPLFRFVPPSLGRLFDSPRLLRWITRGGARTHPEHLGSLTVSVLRGEQGPQNAMLDELVTWLQSDVRPEIVHLSNALLAGLAPPLHHRLQVPIVCTLSGEDLFLEKLVEPHRSQARSILQERAADLSVFVALNRYYADYMAHYLAVARDRIRVMPPGLNLAGHGTPDDRPTVPREPGKNRHEFVIGFLARICPDKGLHLLAEAMILLQQQKGLPHLRLLAAGYLDRTEHGYLAKVRDRLASQGMAESFQYVGALDRTAKIAFLQSLDLFCVPTIYRESKGLFALEAWANRLPAVLPAHGAFPGLIEETGGGILFEPGNPSALATALRQMIEDPQLAADCALRAQKVVHTQYSAQVSAQRMLALYREIGAPCPTS